MNQNPQSNYKTRRAEKHEAEKTQRATARLAAAALLTVAASGPGPIGVYGAYPDTNWHLRKQRPTSTWSRKSGPGFSNGVNADTKSIVIELEKVEDIGDTISTALGTVPSADQSSPESGPVEVPEPILPDAQ